MYETISLERDNGIGIITLNRPDSLNAFSFQLIEELHEALNELDRDLKTRVLIITGAGRVFCSGTDLKEDLDSWPEPVGPVQGRYRLNQRVAELSVRVREIHQPVIAAVHGAAAGGGLALSLACDIRIADETAKFIPAMIRIGASGGDMGASWFLPRLVGFSSAAEILYTGRTINAEKALEMKLVSRVVEKGAHVRAARELAQEIMGNSPFGIRMTKELLNISLDAPALRHQIQMEVRSQALCSLTDDFKETAKAFFEKRPAHHKDR